VRSGRRKGGHDNHKDRNGVNQSQAEIGQEVFHTGVDVGGRTHKLKGEK